MDDIRAFLIKLINNIYGSDLSVNIDDSEIKKLLSPYLVIEHTESLKEYIRHSITELYEKIRLIKLSIGEPDESLRYFEIELERFISKNEVYYLLDSDFDQNSDLITLFNKVVQKERLNEVRNYLYSFLLMFRNIEITLYHEQEKKMRIKKAEEARKEDEEARKEDEEARKKEKEVRENIKKEMDRKDEERERERNKKKYENFKKRMQKREIEPTNIKRKKKKDP